jgi:hypothetical protein
MAGIVVLYHFFFSIFEYIVYMFKTGEQKVIKDNDSYHISHMSQYSQLHLMVKN